MESSWCAGGNGIEAKVGVIHAGPSCSMPTECASPPRARLRVPGAFGVQADADPGSRRGNEESPIPGAEIQISYPLEHSWLGPSDSSGQTGGSGIARLRAKPCGDTGIVIEARAKGYVSEEQFVPLQAVQALEPAHLFRVGGSATALFCRGTVCRGASAHGRIGPAGRLSRNDHSRTPRRGERPLLPGPTLFQLGDATFGGCPSKCPGVVPAIPLSPPSPPGIATAP